MKFNIQKCKVMRVGDSDSGLKRVSSEYSMGNQKLEYCDTERDLGVIMSTDLKVESQCNEACLKANRMLGLIKRTFVVKTPEVMLNLYIGADSTGATGNFAPVLTQEPGQTLRFAPATFHGCALIF